MGIRTSSGGPFRSALDDDEGCARERSAWVERLSWLLHPHVPVGRTVRRASISSRRAFFELWDGTEIEVAREQILSARSPIGTFRGRVIELGGLLLLVRGVGQIYLTPWRSCPVSAALRRAPAER